MIDFDPHYENSSNEVHKDLIKKRKQMLMQEGRRKSRKDMQCSDKSTYWIAKQKRFPVQ